MVSERMAQGIDGERRIWRDEGGCQPHECPAVLPPVECRGAAEARPQQEGGWLGNWPVKIQLVPPNAPYLEGAKLVIAADCVPFVDPGFAGRVWPGRVVLTACPKLGDAWFHRAKLAQILSPNRIGKIDVLYVDVPCCSGLVRIVREAVKDVRCEAPVRVTKLGLSGSPVKQPLSEEKAEALPVGKTGAGARVDAVAASK